MAKRDIKVEYEFVSTRADGNNSFRTLVITAETEQVAMNVAKIEGFKAFGALFNDNCIDWKVKRD